MHIPDIESRISSLLQNEIVADFSALLLDVFRYQYNGVKPYKEYCDLLNRMPENVRTSHDIPFLPIEVFKTHEVTQGGPCAPVYSCLIE